MNAPCPFCQSEDVAAVIGIQHVDGCVAADPGKLHAQATLLNKQIEGALVEAREDLSGVLCDCDEESTCLAHRVIQALGLSE